MIPIYVRTTIDGLEAEISLSCKVLAEQWDITKKMLDQKDPCMQSGSSTKS